MDVQAARVEAVRRQRRRHRSLGVARGDGEAELGIEHARRRLGVGVRIDAGRKAQEHGLARAAFPRQPVEQGQLVEVVHGHAAHAFVEGGGQLGGALVVAVEGEAVGGEAGGAGHGQLAAADHVHAQPLLRDDGGEGQAEPGLGRVEHGDVGPARAEFAAERACGFAEIGLVEHVEGRAVLLRQRAQVAAAEGQPSGGGKGGRAGQHVALGQGVERVHAGEYGGVAACAQAAPYTARMADGADGLTHLDERGAARMVDVSGKAVTAREAVAEGFVAMRAETLALILADGLPKGDVLAVARVAGIQAAKRASELVPLCHPLPIAAAAVDLAPAGEARLRIEARVRTDGRTGVEMEALAAVSVAALAVYDMCKAVDRGMRVEGVRLLEKRGGASGEWRAP